MLGTNIAQSLAGLPQVAAERVEPKDRRRNQAVRERIARGEPEIVVDLESSEAVRGLTSSRDEESRQDHERHPAYAHGAKEDAGKPRIDVQA